MQQLEAVVMISKLLSVEDEPMLNPSRFKDCSLTVGLGGWTNSLGV